LIGDGIDFLPGFEIRERREVAMAVVRFEPFRELAALQNEMGRWMTQLSEGSGPGNGSSWLPAVDVEETDNALVLSFDLPGVEEEKISVELGDGVLTVSGERERASENSGEGFYRYERRFGHFSRSVTLPTGVNEEGIQADYSNGVLEVWVPKPEDPKPRRIQIGGGEKATIEGKAKAIDGKEASKA
jgi:HSP20 family protein